MKKVLVLLSVYNGERFVEEQLDSIVAQHGVAPWILVRDDGSKDNSISILKAFAIRHSNIDVRVGENIGFAGSFIELMRIASKEYGDKVDLFSFADQDDFWKPDKLSRAAKMLVCCEAPSLYLSDVMMVDAELHPLGQLTATPSVTQGVAHDLVDCFTLGCTFVFNRKLLDLVVGLTKDQLPPSHDKMVYLAARTLGKVFADRSCTMLYRQHGDNVYGGAQSKDLPMKRRFQKLFYHRNLIYDHLRLLEPRILDMQKKDAVALSALLASKRSFIRRVLTVARWRQLGLTRKTFLEDVKKKIKILLGVF